MIKLLAFGAIAGMLFQIGHFFEHAFQFLIWCLGDLSQICGRDTPWMSKPVTEAVEAAGTYLSPTSNGARRLMIGLETLHLLGNSIFLASLVMLNIWMPNRWVKMAMFVEGFHLYEHLMLTASAVFIGKPIGLSTLFGGSFLLDKEAAVGIRVSWHFAMNLLPMPFAMFGMLEVMGWPKALSAKYAAAAR